MLHSLDTRWLLLLSCALGLAGCATGKGTALTACETDAAAALQTCVASHSEAARSCLTADDGDCSDEAAAQDRALDDLGVTLDGSCGDKELFGLSSAAASERLQEACASQSDALAWRSFGGPQNAVWNDASGDEQSCLATAHEAGAAVVDRSLAALQDCGTGCTAAGLQAAQQAAVEEAIDTIEGACDALDQLIAVDAPTFAARTAHQADCLAATAVDDGGALELDCGPTHAPFELERGAWVQVVLDSEEWGTLCGDGSDYAFQIKLAPEGAPLDRVFVGLQGGGVCIFEEDCTARLASAPQLFSALDDEPLELAITSADPDESPFADWTKVLLPYCTQDVFAGGGAIEELGSLDLPRYGGKNLRVSMEIVRDLLWRELDAEGNAGYRPDQITAAFGGWSAGAYGTLYNYHWFLDDLLWPRTLAFPDAGLALDNEDPLGVAALGYVKIPAWGTLPNLPPYCFDGRCAVGPDMLQALSPRLRTVPEQQILLLSNQKDLIQQGDAYFQDEAQWINTMRRDHCDTRELNGVHWYLTGVSDQSVHVVTIQPELWQGSVDGVVMQDWFQAAVDDPDSLSSHAEEGDFMQAVPGVEPFPCEL